jgi:hypothetical protein
VLLKLNLQLCLLADLFMVLCPFDMWCGWRAFFIFGMDVLLSSARAPPAGVYV